MIRHYKDEDEASVVGLWENAFRDARPHNDPTTAILRKQTHNDDLFLVAIVYDRVVGTVMGGYDGHRGWLYSLAVDMQYRRQGVATALVDRMETLLRRLGCPKVNLQVRDSNHEVIEFYKKLGYLVEHNISMGKLLSD